MREKWKEKVTIKKENQTMRMKEKITINNNTDTNSSIDQFCTMNF